MVNQLIICMKRREFETVMDFLINHLSCKRLQWLLKEMRALEEPLFSPGEWDRLYDAMTTIRMALAFPKCLPVPMEFKLSHTPRGMEEPIEIVPDVDACAAMEENLECWPMTVIEWPPGSSLRSPSSAPLIN